LKLESIIKRFKVRQSLAIKICKDLSIFISVASVLLDDGGGPSESSSESLYGEDVFLEIGTGSVYF
jgi:hypothetical protein